MLGCERTPVVASVAQLAFSAERLDYGAPLVGSKVSRTVEVTNRGSGTLTVSLVSIEVPGIQLEFTSPDLGAAAWSLKPGESRPITVALSPKDEHVDTGRLCLDSNDDANVHSCIALTSRQEGTANLCGCVIESNVVPSLPCDLATQRLTFPPGTLGSKSTRTVVFEDCGSGNQPLTIGDRNDLYFNAGPPGLKVRSLSDAALSRLQSFPVVLQPFGIDEAGMVVAAPRFFAEVSFEPFSVGAQPPSELCVAFRGEAGPKTACLPVQFDGVACPSGKVDLDRSAANGCECTVSNETCDGADNDCNGLIDDVDADRDRYFACEFWAARDCDDTQRDVHPGAAETCNRIDDNCNSFIDEGVTTEFAQDADGDGYANAATQHVACTAPSSIWRPFSQLQGFDCNDTNAAIRPGASETCNNADDDCNGLVDDGLTQLNVFLDLDGDGFAATNATQYQACRVPIGYTQRRDVNGDGTPDHDCNDSNITVYPGAPELCDGLLNNCLRTVADQTCARQCPGQWPAPVGTSSGRVLVAQLDPSDNELEVLTSGGATVQVLSHTGQVKWSRPLATNYSHPSVADVNLDGRLEVVHAVSGTIYVLNGQTGATMASFPGGPEGAYYGPVLASDLNNDGVIDLIGEGNGATARALLLNSNLTVRSQLTLTIPAAQSMTLAQPFVWDFDRDGQAESAWNTGGWGCTVGTDCQFRIAAIATDGGRANDPEQTFSVPFRNTGHGGEGYWPIVADLDHDGVAELAIPVTNKAGAGSGTYVWQLDGGVHATLMGAQSLDTTTLAPIDAMGAVSANGVLRGVGGPSVDLNADGRFEVLSVGGSGLIVTQGGQPLPGYPVGSPGQTPTIADLSLDGTLEVLYLGSADQRVHCLQFGQDTWSPMRVAGMGFDGWNRGSMLTRALDPLEPNDPGARSVNVSMLTRSTVVQTTRAASLAPFQLTLQSGSGWTRELFGLIGERNDRDFYWSDSSGYVSARLSVPGWAPVQYAFRAHFYDAATGAFAGTVNAPSGSLYCHPASTPCPGGGASRVVFEVYPLNPANDFGPWPYHFVTQGLF